jgi:hypothetical protein
MKNLSTYTLLAPLVFVVFFVTMWPTVCALLARLSGWQTLAIRFGVKGEVIGEQFRYGSGSIGSSSWFPVGYRNCLNVTVSESGLGLALLVLFRFSSPAMFIPWEQVESVEDGRVWLVRCAIVRVRGTSTRIGLQGKPGQSALAAYERFEQRRGVRSSTP